MNKKHTFSILSIILVFSIFFPFLLNAQKIDTILLDTIIKTSIPTTYQLKTNLKSNLIDYRLSDDNQTISYSYITDKILTDSIQINSFNYSEDLTLRKSNLNIYPKQNNSFLYKFIPGNQRIKINTDWFQVEKATTTKTYFEQQIGDTKIQSIVRLFTGRLALAACGDDGASCYAGTQDGDVWAGDSVWATVRAKTDGGDYSLINGMRAQATHPSTYQIQRGFLPIDTSAIPDSATINTATIYLNPYAHSGSNGVNIWKGTQSDTLGLSDFDAFSGSAIATSASSWTDGVYVPFQLFNPNTNVNNNGVSKYTIRIDKDYDNVAPTSNNYVFFYGQENAGTSQDPYLLIDLTDSLPATATTCATVFPFLGTNRIDLVNKYLYIALAVCLFGLVVVSNKYEHTN